MARLERANAGVKVLCLTAWRHPNVEKTRRTGSYSRSPDQWGGIRGSNPRHPEPQSGALPTELIPPYTFQSFCFDAGAPGGTRTPGLLLRRQLLYPAELLAHIQEPSENGAGEGNRTLVPSLEGWYSTIELHPQTRLISGTFIIKTKRKEKLKIVKVILVKILLFMSLYL